MLYIAFLMQCISSSTFNDLSEITTRQSCEYYLEKLRDSTPTLSLHIECLQHEEKSEQCKDKRRNYCKTRTLQSKVATHSESLIVRVMVCQDVSEQLEFETWFGFGITKIRLNKAFIGDENYTLLKQSLIEKCHAKGKHYNLVEKLIIKDFKPHLMAYEQPFYSPWCVGIGIFALMHVLVVPALAYRVWLWAITQQKQVVIKKIIFTAGP